MMHPYGTEFYPEPFTNDAALAFLGVFLFVVLLVSLVVTAFFVWLYYRIFEKAGFSGWYGLFSLIPGVGPFICIAILAFADWPAQRKGFEPVVTPVVEVAQAPATTESTEE